MRRPLSRYDGLSRGVPLTCAEEATTIPRHTPTRVRHALPAEETAAVSILEIFARTTGPNGLSSFAFLRSSAAKRSCRAAVLGRRSLGP